MHAPASRQPRERTLDEIAEALPLRADALSRLFLTRSTVQISRTEAGVLGALSPFPRRVTELAAREGVTQPAMSRLVDRLGKRGWLERRPDPGDGRVVLVALTAHGQSVLDGLRSEYRALLHEEMATLPTDDVDTLARAIEILDELIEQVTGHEP